jgi:glycosyltransferase involved in cell wall biosynthesis
MRILTVVDLPSDARLGAARIFMELSRAWESAEHRVSHYCLDDAFPASTSSAPLSAWRRLRFPGRAAAFVRKNAAQFDVIDCLAGVLPVAKHRLNFTGLLVARSIGSHRLYRDFEKMARERWPDQPRGKLSGRIFYTIFQQRLFRNSEKALHYCDLVNLPNEYELECLGSKKPAIIQPYGLTEERCRTLVEAAASPETRLLEQKVSFVGMWSTRKGARDWGKIIRRVRAIVPGARFKFLGTLTDNERVWRDLNIPPCDWIDIVPEYQPDELPKLLSDSTVGAFPSYAEGFGLGLLEQLAAGIPTVSYDAPGPRFILQGGLSDLLVPIGNVEQLSAALIRILSADRTSYRKLIERCIEVAGRFLWSTIAKETARLYETHLARVRRGISELSGHD